MEYFKNYPATIEIMDNFQAKGIKEFYNFFEKNRNKFEGLLTLHTKNFQWQMI